MIFTSSNFGAGCIKDSRDQKLKKTSAHSVSLRLCVKNLWDGCVFIRSNLPAVTRTSEGL